MKTFSDKVIQLACNIPKGRVTTYGAIAKACGGGGMAAQSITTILAKAYNQGRLDIPFHRIVYADGHVWMDKKHKKQRLELYKKEGIHIDEKGRIQNFRDILIEY